MLFLFFEKNVLIFHKKIEIFEKKSYNSDINTLQNERDLEGILCLRQGVKARRLNSRYTMVFRKQCSRR